MFLKMLVVLEHTLVVLKSLAEIGLKTGPYLEFNFILEESM